MEHEHSREKETDREYRSSGVEYTAWYIVEHGTACHTLPQAYQLPARCYGNNGKRVQGLGIPGIIFSIVSIARDCSIPTSTVTQHRLQIPLATHVAVDKYTPDHSRPRGHQHARTRMRTSPVTKIVEFDRKEQDGIRYENLCSFFTSQSSWQLLSYLTILNQI